MRRGSMDRLRGERKVVGPTAGFFQSRERDPESGLPVGPTCHREGKREKIPKIGKINFDCRNQCLYFTFLNELKAEFENIPIG